MLRRVLKRLLALVAALLVLLPSTAIAATGLEAKLLRDLNRVRAEHGLAPLRLDDRLERAARAHTREMLASNVFAHGAFDSRMAAFDIRGLAVGENLAFGTGAKATSAQIIRAWLLSPEHRANMLRPSFRHIGIGDLVGSFFGYTEAHVVTADFSG